METVDVAEVAALERASEAHAYTPGDVANLCAVCQLSMSAKVHVMPSHAAAAAQDQLRAESSVPRASSVTSEAGGGPAPVGPTAPPSSSPKGALELLVEEAIDARLGPIRDALQRIERRGFHAMALAMVIGDRYAVSEAEIQECYQAAIRTERARGGK
jgi:hypothetical protein